MCGNFCLMLESTQNAYKDIMVEYSMPLFCSFHQLARQFHPIEGYLKPSVCNIHCVIYLAMLGVWGFKTYPHA